MDAAPYVRAYTVTIVEDCGGMACAWTSVAVRSDSREDGRTVMGQRLTSVATCRKSYWESYWENGGERLTSVATRRKSI